MRESMREGKRWLQGEEDIDDGWRTVFAAADRRNVIYHDPNSFLRSGVLPPNASVFLVEILESIPPFVSMSIDEIYFQHQDNLV